MNSHLKESQPSSGSATPKRKKSNELTSSQESDKKKLCQQDSTEFVMVESETADPSSILFTKNTKAIVWGLQHRAVQVCCFFVSYVNVEPRSLMVKALCLQLAGPEFNALT